MHDLHFQDSKILTDFILLKLMLNINKDLIKLIEKMAIV